MGTGSRRLEKRAIALALLAAVLLLAACQAAPHPEGPMLAMTAGHVGIQDDVQSNRFGLEYRMGEYTDLKLIPSLGLAWSTDDAYFLSAEVRRNFWLADRLVLTPSFGPGYFNDGFDLDLGGDIEFRTGLEVTYCFDGDYRLGLAVFHLSNGGLFDSNPGTEAVALTFTIPIGPRPGEE